MSIKRYKLEQFLTLLRQVAGDVVEFGCADRAAGKTSQTARKRLDAGALSGRAGPVEPVA